MTPDEEMSIEEYQELLKGKKPNKQHAIKTVVDGMTFASKKEADRYSQLKLLQRNGDIVYLQTQVKFSLNVAGVHICDYIADFVYVDRDKNGYVVEDVKGQKSGTIYQVFRIKKKLMKACYDIDVIEI
jgi:hypothetical protein